ncbi:MAG: hypothetical protein BIFFINMI_03951 [Phycisphaerae bacterium]|nr:hypothetical protein [Phycisphaerae bacterium]
MYSSGNERVAFLAMTFEGRDQAEAEYTFLQENPSPEWLLGQSKQRDDTIVLLAIKKDCNAHGFFVGYFNAITR